jgi:hypothetical protein
MKKTQPNMFATIKNNLFNHIDKVVQNLNTSKAFAGLMIIILNIGSRFVTIKLSKSMEAYLKYTFSKQILIFAIAWMGTRDIYIAILVTLIFTICMEYLFNEDSKFCCLPEHFTNYHIELLENDEKQKDEKSKQNTNDISDTDIQKAKEVLEKAGVLKTSSNESGNYTPYLLS